VGDTLAALRRGSATAAEVARLSDLDRGQTAELAAAWPTLPESTREAVVRRMESLAEERLDVNFGRALRVALGDSSAVVRQLAIAALWEDEGTDLLDRLLTLVADDPSPDVRAEAAKALARFAVQAAAGELDPGTTEAVRQRVIALAGAERQPGLVRRRALEAAGAFGRDPVVRGLIHAAYEGDDEGLQASALSAMGASLDRRWLDVLLAAARSQEPEIRYEAARACGTMGDARAVPELLELAFDHDSEVRHAAINGLGAIGGQGAVRALRALAASEEVPDSDAGLIESALEEASATVEPLRVEP